MRLIHTKSYELHEFVVVPLEGFAVLSHRWEEEEMTFALMENNSVKQLQRKHHRRWAKIQHFCDVAAELGITWAWADTVCINKDSSAELSEAINSMYKWYPLSTVCIVYMKDVSDVTDVSFRSSKWFKRGWTLQELIAPPKLNFFNRDWRFIGTRQELSKEIATFTRIPEPILYSPSYSNARWMSVAERMSWAAGRHTTQGEDCAYCLLGLFDINMPLLYGEGSKNAFYRLQKEIIAQSYDESIFCSLFNSNRKGPPLHLVEGMSNPGILATKPSHFWYTKGIKVSKALEQLQKPYHVTNRGVHFERMVRVISQNDINLMSSDLDLLAHVRLGDWIMPLHCMYKDKNLSMLLRHSPHDEEVLCCINVFDFKMIEKEAEFKDFFVSPLRSDQLVPRSHLWDPKTKPPYGYLSDNIYGIWRRTLGKQC